MLVPALALVLGRVVDERVGAIVLSAFVAHTAWHWLVERWAVLMRFQLQWPDIDATFLAAVLRWAMLAVLVVLAAWIVRPAVAKASAGLARGGKPSAARRRAVTVSGDRRGNSRGSAAVSMPGRVARHHGIVKGGPKDLKSSAAAG